jgi:hypothetical protein
MERREHSHGMEDLSVVNEFLEVRTCMILFAHLILATLDFYFLITTTFSFNHIQLSCNHG